LAPEFTIALFTFVSIKNRRQPFFVQLPANMSVMHRGTGIALSGMMMGVAAGSLILPMPFPEALAIVKVSVGLTLLSRE
jgi:hypothetical protein